MPFYKTYKPSAILDPLIWQFEIYQVNWNEEKDAPPPFITCLANTGQGLYFYINDPIKVVLAEKLELKAPHVVVTGPKSKPVGLLFGKDHLMLKVDFKPTGTYRLLGINMEELVNKGLDATTIWGNEITAVIKQLRDISYYDSMIEIVSNFLERKVLENCRPEEAIDTIASLMLDPFQDHSLDEWASMACLSLRQFERSFITRVGLTPKLFMRIVRFEYAMKIKNDFPEKSWKEIAFECGYTDSSHILKEFKEFADFPPSRFYLQPTSGYSDFPTG